MSSLFECYYSYTTYLTHICSESDLTDVEFDLAPLSTTLFPGVSSSVEVHSGFQDEHALTAATILAEVKSLMASKGTNNLVMVRPTPLLSECTSFTGHRLDTLLEGH